MSPILISSVATTSFSLMIGHDLALEQREQRVARVQVPLTVGQIGTRQQCLRDDQIFLRKQLVPHLHQLGLPDRGQHLLERDVLPVSRDSTAPAVRRRWRQTTRAPPGARRATSRAICRATPSMAGRARRSSPPVSVLVPTLTTRRFFVRSPMFAGLILYRAIIAPHDRFLDPQGDCHVCGSFRLSASCCPPLCPSPPRPARRTANGARTRQSREARNTRRSIKSTGTTSRTCASRGASRPTTSVRAPTTTCSRRRSS